VTYPTPINFGYLNSFGAVAGVLLGVQIMTGLVLARFYTPHIDFAFLSVEYIRRDVN
jgi:quinol-cytochrome oxidoreductase complex cytochrome b subunit